MVASTDPFAGTVTPLSSRNSVPSADRNRVVATSGWVCDDALRITTVPPAFSSTDFPPLLGANVWVFCTVAVTIDPRTSESLVGVFTTSARNSVFTVVRIGVTRIVAETVETYSTAASIMATATTKPTAIRR